MASKPTVEQFIRDCFRERTASLKRRLEIHHVYWRRFYHSECLFDSRRRVIEKSEAEKIVSVSSSDIEIGVVTTGEFPTLRSHFRIKSSGESWLIQEVDTECRRCTIRGASTECSECRGTGWLTWKTLSKYNKQDSARTTNSTPEEDGKGRGHRDPAIEQFMADHFQERTVARKREVEINAEYAKRFYSPECDWTRWVPSAQESEAERIANVMAINIGAQVITRNPGRFQKRYHLRPADQSWLIWEVDIECPLCYDRGRRADCFYCGGTIWDHKKAKSGHERG